jgi:hypothetical protein
MEMIKITLMKEPDKAGGCLYSVNEDGSVGPFGNKPKSVAEAMGNGYTIHEVEVLGEKFRKYVPPPKKKKIPMIKEEFAKFLSDYYASGKPIPAFLNDYEI